MIPGRYDFEVWRGTTPRFVFAVLDSNQVPVEFDDIRVSFAYKGNLLFRKTYVMDDSSESPGGVVSEDEYAGTFRVVLTPEDTRTIREASDTKPYTPATYEIEVWHNGSQLVYLWGEIVGRGGRNDD